MDPSTIKNIVTNIKYPVVLKNQCKWPILNWSLENWANHLGDKKLCFRGRPKMISDQPCWERECPKHYLTFNEFVSKDRTKDWLYFDYKYADQWCPENSAICKQINWESFGFPEIGVKESTLWIGSEGSHTPCHQDSYGKNIVLQVYGEKRWFLFPPDCSNMKTTRVPYEESSIYSQHNFYYPRKLIEFKGLSGCRMVILKPGDVLIVPHKWWHYVEHTSHIGITLNTWIPHKSDPERRLEESLTRTIISQFSKDVPEESLLSLLNPNEDDVPDISLDSNLAQIKLTLNKFIESQKNNKRQKRLKTSDNNESSSCETKDQNDSNYIDEIINGCDDIQAVEEITSDKLVELLKEILKIRKEEDNNLTDERNEDSLIDQQKETTDFSSSLLRAMCQPNVIQQIKENLLKDLYISQ